MTFLVVFLITGNIGVKSMCQKRHLVTFTETGLYLITCNPGHIGNTDYYSLVA